MTDEKRKRHNGRSFVTCENLVHVTDIIGDHITALTKRVAELEAQPAFDYTGTHQEGRAYRKGQGCTHGGSIFIALRDDPGTPGKFGCGWQLACKRGRDAK